VTPDLVRTGLALHPLGRQARISLLPTASPQDIGLVCAYSFQHLLEKTEPTMSEPTSASTIAIPAGDVIPPGAPPCHGFGGRTHHCNDQALRYVSAEDRQKIIARLAYQNAERRGFGPGGELADWIAAEIQVGEGLGDK
jgi:hypothetical protein